jgi:Fe-Mn family superoxide dismutase
MLGPRLRIAARPRLSLPVQSSLPSLAQQARSNHTLPSLHYNEKGDVSRDGIKDFLGPAAFNISWPQYQTHLLGRLNALIAGMFYG